MPVLKESVNVKRVKLPSFKDPNDGAWVDVKKDLSVGDLLEGLKGINQAEQNILVITSAIRDWNLTDENGEKLPITAENVKKLKAVDFMAIANEVEVDLPTQLKPEEKKS
jgi:hypothetical protein